MATTSLPVLQPSRDALAVLSELQSLGARWIGETPDLSRSGGAGPSDHKAVVFAGQTIMVPIHTIAAQSSPYAMRARPASGEGSGSGARAIVEHLGVPIGEVTFPPTPRFYAGSTAEGIPYWKIAQLHGTDVLATTVLQLCTRYTDRATSCQFCAIGQSLEAGKTIARKTPAQLAEVAEAAARLDGVRHMVMTTGTPGGSDRGARSLAEAAGAILARVDLPIQAQCEPPDDDVWFDRLKAAGVVSLGMHLEAVSEPVRRKIMPGKAEIPVSRYMTAFERAVAVFGRGQVSTYVLAGLGDSRQDILDLCRAVSALGVYPFVVPFVPIRGTPLANHAPPGAAFMHDLLAEVAAILGDAGLGREDIRAGCGRCGACSTLGTHESARKESVS